MVNNPRRAAFIVFGLWLAVILGVTIRGLVAPHQNSVFLVFRDAGRAWLAGQPLYSHVGKYLYSPLAAALFSPFALIPDGAASALWRLVTGLAYLIAVVCWFLRYTVSYSSSLVLVSRRPCSPRPRFGLPSSLSRFSSHYPSET